MTKGCEKVQREGANGRRCCHQFSSTVYHEGFHLLWPSFPVSQTCRSPSCYSWHHLPSSAPTPPWPSSPPPLHNHTWSLCSSQVTCLGFHWELAFFLLVWPAGPNSATHTHVYKWWSKMPVHSHTSQTARSVAWFMLNLHDKTQALAELHLWQRWETERVSSFSQDYAHTLDWHKTAVLFHGLLHLVQLSKVEHSCRNPSSNQDRNAGKKRSQLVQVPRESWNLSSLHLGATSSQNHRLVWIRRDLKVHLVPTPWLH